MSSDRKVTRLSGIKRAGFSILSTMANRLIDNVKDSQLRDMWRDQVGEPLNDIKGILKDNDPNDAEQIKTLWKEKQGVYKANSLDSLKTIVEKVIDNDDVSNIIVDIITDYQNDFQADGYKTPPVQA